MHAVNLIMLYFNWLLSFQQMLTNVPLEQTTAMLRWLHVQIQLGHFLVIAEVATLVMG